MEFDLKINGEPVEFTVDLESDDPADEITWPDLRDALREDLESQGWAIQALSIDGRDGLSEDEIELGGHRHQVEVAAAPTQAMVDGVSKQLRSAVPEFKTRTHDLAQLFSRGEWKDALGGIPLYLDEMSSLLTGFQVVAAYRNQEVPPALAKIPTLLESLNGNLAKQSWVEVADILQYELLPILEGLLEDE